MSNMHVAMLNIADAALVRKLKHLIFSEKDLDFLVEEIDQVVWNLEVNRFVYTANNGVWRNLRSLLHKLKRACMEQIIHVLEI